MSGGAVSGVLLRASWRIAFTLLLWVFIIFIILIVFKCLKSLAIIVKNQGRVTSSSCNSESQSQDAPDVRPGGVPRDPRGAEGVPRNGRRTDTETEGVPRSGRGADAEDEDATRTERGPDTEAGGVPRTERGAATEAGGVQEPGSHGRRGTFITGAVAGGSGDRRRDSLPLLSPLSFSGRVRRSRRATAWLVLLGHSGPSEAPHHPSRSARVQPYTLRRGGQGQTGRSGRRGPSPQTPVTTPTLVPRPPLADQPALEYFPPHTPVVPPGPSPLPPPYSLDLPPSYETLFPSNQGHKGGLPPV